MLHLSSSISFHAITVSLAIFVLLSLALSPIQFPLSLVYLGWRPTDGDLENGGCLVSVAPMGPCWTARAL